MRWGFLLVVDEAHATLVAGVHGGGTSQAQGVCDAVDIHTGTLSKAAGALGGYVACSSGMRALLLNRGRSGVFSTALPVPVAVAARTAIEVAAR
jgi:8-amino-7-oxononanoate synthase